jgi:hypothetical protein
MDRPSFEAIEERDFRDAVGVEVSKTDHGFVEVSVQISVIYVAVGPVNSILRRAMIRHFVGVLNRKVSEGVGLTTQRSLTTVSFRSPRKNSSSISHPTCPGNIRPRMMRISKVPTFYIQLRHY